MIHSSPAYSGEKKFYVQVKYTKATSPWPWHVQIISIWLLLNWLWFLLHVLILWWVEPNWSPRPIQFTNIGSIINQITFHSRIIWNRKIQFLLWANQFSCLLRRSMARHLLKEGWEKRQHLQFKLYHAVLPVSSSFVCCKSLVPQPDASLSVDWWACTNDSVDNQVLQSMNSVIILGAWSLWNHQNLDVSLMEEHETLLAFCLWPARRRRAQILELTGG